LTLTRLVLDVRGRHLGQRDVVKCAEDIEQGDGRGRRCGFGHG